MQLKEAIILAGGKGTRLQSVVSDIPKPMATICGKPFLEILIEHFYAKGIEHFILSVGYMSEVIVGHFEKKYPTIQISFSFEDQPLGTGGAIRLAFEHVRGESVLVLNGDSLFDVDLDKLESFSSSNLPIVYGRHVDDVSRYGQFLYENDKIHHYIEKQGQGPGYINGGVYVLGKETLASFQLNQKFSIETEFFSQFSKENTATIVFSDGYFIDIGIPDSYEAAQKELKPYIKNKALFLDRDGVINVDTGYLHKLEDCVFVNGILDLLKKAKDLGYLIIVVTNQAGIGRRYYSEDEFHSFMDWMNCQLDSLIDDYFFCPFHAEHGIGQYKCDSWDRKPNPGMFEKAIQKHNISPKQSLMIGDRLTDIQAANKVNLAQTLLLSPARYDSQEIITINSLSEAEKFL